MAVCVCVVLQPGEVGLDLWSEGSVLAHHQTAE